MAYPVEVPRQGLYEASTTQLHPLGTVCAFNEDIGNGVKHRVYARYMGANNASIPAGQVVAYANNGTDSPYYCDTAPVANVSLHGQLVAGINCASMQASGTRGYGWVAFQGPITAASLGESIASNVTSQHLVAISSAGVLRTVVTNPVTSAADDHSLLIGRLGFTASTLSRSLAPVAGAYVTLFHK
jgi:hypothetical protein